MSTSVDTATVKPLTRGRIIGDSLFIAAVSVLAAVLGLTGLWDAIRFTPERLPAYWTLVWALPGCALLLFKGRHPMPVLIGSLVLWIGDLLTCSGLGSLMVFADALWTATYRGSERKRRRILFGLTVGIAVLTIVVFLRVFDLGLTIVVALGIGALFGTTYWAAAAVARAGEVAELHRRARDAEAARAEQDRTAAIEHERAVMAGELHDLVAGHVSAVALRAEAALIAPPNSANDRDALRAVRESSLQAHAALRSMITVLRTGEIVAPERLDAVPGMVADAERAGLTVTTRIAVSPALPAPLDQAAARIIREGLTNAARHSTGRVAHVDVDERDGRLRIIVRSTGGDASRSDVGSGWGLDMLRERVRALGGTLAAGAEGDDWILRADLPLVADDTESAVVGGQPAIAAPASGAAARALSPRLIRSAGPPRSPGLEDTERMTGETA